MGLEYRKSRIALWNKLQGLDEIELRDFDPMLNILTTLGINLEELNSCISVLK